VPEDHLRVLVHRVRADGSAAVYAPTDEGSFGTATATVNPFGNVPANVRSAVADVDKDGSPDLILVTGPGTPLRVAVLSGKDNAVLVAPFNPFPSNPGEAEFTAGGFAAAGDMDGDGRAEFVISPDRAGGPRVTIYSFTNGAAAVRANFFTVDPDFRGGARTAIGDFNRDGSPDLVVAAGFGGGPRVVLLDGKKAINGFPGQPLPSDKLIGDFFAFDPGLRDGAYLAAGDVDGDGFADLIFGPGDGGPATLLVVSGQVLTSQGAVAAIGSPVARFTPSDLGPDGAGVRVAVTNADGDGRADVVVGAGRGRAGLARVYLGKTLAGTTEPGGSQRLDPFGGAVLADGVYVG